MKRKRKIKTVIRSPGDMVMVFAGRGEQIPEYQGQYQAVKDSILKNAPLNAVFAYFSGSNPGFRQVPREEW